MLGAKESFAAQLASTQQSDNQPACENRSIEGKIKPICISKALFSTKLPPQVRGKLFLHYLHICAVMHCPFAPVNDIRKHVKDYRKYISATPLLSKGTIEEMDLIYRDLHTKFFSASTLLDTIYTVKSLIDGQFAHQYIELPNAVNFLMTSVLKGKRPTGNRNTVINANLNTAIHMRYSDITGAPIMLFNPLNDRAAIISDISSDFNQGLLSQYITISDMDIFVDPSFPL